MAETRDAVAKAVESFNAHDEGAIKAGYAENAVFTAPGEVELGGPAAITEYAMTWLRAFPDAKLTIHNVVEEGEWAAVRFTFAGTHTETLAGPEGDIPATNRPVSGRGSELFRIQGGKIVEEHLYFDQVQVMTQLGLMPEAAAATT